MSKRIKNSLPYDCLVDRHHGMTLIELLVVITILTTLVAGVIPLLSPNNEPRKIREASREAQNYITLAQAEAARTGRPHGVFLQKLSATTGSDLDRGVCLELFQIEEPAPFSGFSETSVVNVYDIGGGYYRAQFGNKIAGTFTPSLLELPLAMFRPGDIVNVEGNLFRLLKESDLPEENNDLDNSGFFNSTNGPTAGNSNGDGFRAIWLNNIGQIVNPSIGKPYQIRRLPMRSAEPPLQLPKGVCIDLQCSGLPVDQMPSCCHNPLIAVDGTDPMLTNNDDGVAVLFAPDGTVDRYFWNDANNQVAAQDTVDPERVTSKIFMLVGRRENVPVEMTTVNDWDFQSRVDDHEELREKVNWLNGDSRWVVIGASSGRVLATNNAFVDLTNPVYSPATNDLAGLMVSVPAQMFAARQYAREMRREGGR